MLHVTFWGCLSLYRVDCWVVSLCTGLSTGLCRVEYWVVSLDRVEHWVVFLCTGLSTGLSPLYNSEVAPVSLRGAIGVVNQLAVTVGISVSQILGLTEILGDDFHWPLLLGMYM